MVRTDAYLDSPRLGLFGHRDGDGEDAPFVVSLDALGIEGFVEHDLAAERAERPLGDDGLNAFSTGRCGSYRRNDQDIVIDA